MFLFEGRGRLCSPTLKEFIEMLPETVEVPICCYNANQWGQVRRVRRALEPTRVLVCVEEIVEESGNYAGTMAPRLGHHLPSESGHGEGREDLLVAQQDRVLGLHVLFPQECGRPHGSP